MFGEEAHCEPTRSAAAEDYVYKDDTAVEGTRFELGKRAMKRNKKEDWEDCWQKCKSGDIEGIPGDVKIKYYGNIKRIAKDYMLKPEDLENVCGEWIFGPPGVGKSRKAR